METNHQILYNYYNDYYNRIHGGNFFKNIYRRWFPKKNTNMNNNVVYNNPLFKNNVVYNNPLSENNNILNRPIPSLVKTDLTLYNLNNTKGGYSDVIIPVVNKQYKRGYTRMINNKLNLNFEFVDLVDKILYGAGTYTAVYKIKDINSSINDPNVIDDIYILRLTVITNNDHIYDDPKIKKEYDLFNKYLPKIYYYGTLFIDNPYGDKYHYTITKVYIDFQIVDDTVVIPNILSNTDKFVFLYNNVIMLNDLLMSNYTHFDYKITNIGFEINELTKSIDIILIDYDKNTLQELSIDNDSFNINKYDETYVIDSINIPTTYIPPYLSNKDNDKPYIFDYKYTIKEFDKYAVFGLYYLIITLDIKFKENMLSLYSIPQYNILINNYNLNNTIYLDKLSNTYYDELHLSNSDYDKIPTYKLIIRIFSIIMKNKEKYLF
jgi:hypothetical protein